MVDGPRIYRPRESEAVAENGEHSLDDFTAQLNPEQAAAASYGDGALLIVAGAGTGKTRTLVYRVAHLLQHGVKAERILLLTFTRRAAHEMLTRAERLVGVVSGHVHGGTFHSTGNRLLRTFGQSAGLPKDFSIMDEADAEDLIGLARANLGYGKQEKRFPKKETLHWIYSRHVNTEVPVEDILGGELPQFADYTDDVLRIFAEYTSRKIERNLVDYDDLLLFWQLMLEHSAPLAERIAALYDHILVDEYQDSNLTQARILRGMCRTHQNITVVGDDAQSIYSFRGANVHNILDFPKQFPGAHLVTLEQNYRSTQPILDVTNTLISRAEHRFTKNLWTKRGGGETPWLVAARDEQQQTKFVVDRVLELHEEGIPLREIAVLFRAAYMSADLEIELSNRRVPFEKWGGLKFLEAAHVKDVLAFLRVIENPRDDVSWYRILMLRFTIGCRRSAPLKHTSALSPCSGPSARVPRVASRSRSALASAPRSKRFVACMTTSSASATTAPKHALRTSNSYASSPVDIQIGPRFSRPSRSSRRRVRRISRLAATPRTTRSYSALRTAPREKSGTPSFSSGPWTDSFRSPAPLPTTISSRRSAD
jgi:DNA helicase-2/ATP-dependent DNA helicase PcrA